MGNQWQQKYLLEYNELVSNFPSPERVVSDYIKNCFKTDLPWFSRIDPDNAYFICFYAVYVCFCGPELWRRKDGPGKEGPL